MAKVIIDGIEYVPRANVPEITDKKLEACIRELVSIQYFEECSHKHRAWAWDALNAIAPEMAELAGDNPKAAFERMNPESAT